MGYTQLLVFDGETESLLATLSNRAVGRANYYDAYHTEQLNGDNQFEFRMQADHADAAFVVAGNYVGYKDLDGIIQLFQIYKTEDVSDGQRLYKYIFAEHIFYELLDDVVVNSSQTNVSATTALTAALSQTRWNTGTVEIATNQFYDYFYQSAISSIQQVAGRWGGELRFRVTLSATGQITGRFVDLLTRRGTDTKKRFQFNRDMVSVLRRENMSNLKTALYGRGAAVETTAGGNKEKITFSDIVWSTAAGDPVNKPAGQEWIGDPVALAAYGRASGTRHRFGVYEEGRTTDPATLLQMTWERLQALNKIGITYQTDIVSLEEITGLDQDKVRLGDTIVIIDPTFYPTIRAEARIFELKRAIDDPENTHLTLGNFIELFTDTIEKKLRRLESEVSDNSGIWDQVVTPIDDSDYPDTMPPIPANVTALGNFKTIMVSWTYNIGSVIASYEVYASQVAGFTPSGSNLAWTGKSGGYVHQASVGQTWYFRVRSVNYHGTTSAMSAQVSATTLLIGQNEISDFVITNNMIAANASIDFAKISNVVIVDAMITGTLSASKISVGPTTTYSSGYDPTQIAVGVQNLIRNSETMPIVVSTGTGTVTKNNQFSPIDNVSEGSKNASTLTTTTATTYRFNNIVPANGTYTFSIYMKNSVVGNASVVMDICDGPTKTVTVTNTWTRFFITSTVANWSAATFHFSDINPPTSSTIYVWRPKLESGNKMTDWVPAVEDIDYELSLLESRVSNVEIDIGQDSITQKVVSSTSFQLALDDKADSDSLVDYVTINEFGEVVSGIPGQIGEAIEAIDFTPYVQQTQLQQNLNDITASFKYGGGVNLLKNSTGLSDFDFWGLVGTTSGLSITSSNALDTLGFHNGFLISPTAAGTSKYMYQVVNVIPGVPFTLSWNVNKTNNTATGNTIGALYFQFQNTARTVNLASTSYANDVVTNGYIKGSLTYTPVEGETEVSIRVFGYEAVDATVTGLMLNIGDAPLQWTMATGELYNTSVKFDINGIKVTQYDVDGIETNKTVMTPEKFAGFYDVNGDGVIDTADGSVDEVFKMDKDEFVLKKANVKEEITMANIKIVEITSASYNGWAFLPSS